MASRIEQISHPLDLDEKLNLHHKGWIIQPVGKVLLVGLMVMGLLGLFGEGLLSQQQVRQGTTQLSYEKFFRQYGEMELKVQQAGVSGRSAISFPLDYINHLQVTQVLPQPESTFIRDGQLWYVFQADQNLQVTFYIRPQTRGNLHGSVYVNEDNIPIHHFFYP
ncbi:hypothetical protein SAMN05444008_110189 [Cnuella takakiae]|uniref:Uncharacterized protein n=1 Tax=Cnuella takakiae TaxID=1302690 RepID=A0A1M5DDN5_9BACT|nr:hypothetical protein [Cnuella takakiae]OLY94003.1 hypothetical protein BUE76_20530 [Cnuella takakiae]SHF65109.1 hypothetical protein SAMN05444008_110189 [Cnuella takakiae]